MINTIIKGDALSILKNIPNECVNCAVTSPPYWNLRDYSVEGQIGLEKTFEEYITKLCDIFDEVKRVLRKDGTCWVNLGDSYSASGGSGSGEYQKKHKQFGKTINQGTAQEPHRAIGLPPKSLCLIPQRFAIEMVNRGWICRNTIIWHKTNCMPSSAKDRFTVDFEYVYFFVKSKKYWFEQIFENFESNDYDRNRMANARTEYGGKWAQDSGGSIKTQRAFVSGGANGRNKRAVWTIPTKPFPEDHFAVYPEALIEPMIQAGCPRYVCKKCGKARAKILKPSEEYMGYVNYAPYRNIIDLKIFGEYIKKAREKIKLTRNQVENLLGTNTALAWWEGRKYYGEMQYQLPNPDNYKKLKDILNLDDKYDKAILTIFKKTKEGWVNKAINPNPLIEGNRKGGKSLTASYKCIGLTDCGCNAGFEPGIILDPFMGAGTTALVALKQRKRFIGIEIKQEYIDMSYKRIAKVQQRIF